MKILLLLFFQLMFVIVLTAQSPEKKVYINPAIGFYRLTTNPDNINNQPFMVEVKVGTDIGKRGIIGVQFNSIQQDQLTNRKVQAQVADGSLFYTESGKLTHRVTAFGFFYERLFSIGKHIDLFPGAYMQYLDYKEIEKGHLFTPVDSSQTYSRETTNNYAARIGVNLNGQYRIGKSLALTIRILQLDARLWDSKRRNISGEVPFLIGLRFSY